MIRTITPNRLTPIQYYHIGSEINSNFLFIKIKDYFENDSIDSSSDYESEIEEDYLPYDQS